ncbi:Uncharacterized conserved protein, LabA/DUF88 family [Psychrobacillus sp. OK028]|uniref:NYN domain-containing protein n=1 Tax=Psychrobacillus sp. OK028 TaxID=1884359 RepID=UPI00088EB7C2|nr:NYN domain-containing protein [Psychrobacillus sp. OK028]SDN49819.1 Uncharacterized conserved protein, LabA/DUF88 family [Psychrobacillus sp. OK028]
MSTVCYVDFENLYNSLENEYGFKLTDQGYIKLKQFLISEFQIDKASNIKLFAIWDFFQHVKQQIALLNIGLIDTIINASNSTDGKIVVEALTNSKEHNHIVFLSGDGLFLHPAIYLSQELGKKVSFVALKKSCSDEFIKLGFPTFYLDDLFDITGYQVSSDEKSFENTQALSSDLEIILHKVVHMVNALKIKELAWIGVAHQVIDMRKKQGKSQTPFDKVSNVLALISEGCKNGVFIPGKQPHSTKTGTQDTIKLNEENLHVKKIKRIVDNELNQGV